MYGIILCGGQSSRMGSDKGLLQQGEKCWAQTAAEKLATLQVPVKISINKRQQVAYEKLFPASDLIIDDETLLLKGPLLGLLSCHLAIPNEDLFVLACDMQNIKTDLFISLYKKYQQQNYDAYIFTNNGEAEPICGIYKAKALSNIMGMYKKEKLHRHSMKFVLEQLNVCKIALAEEEKKYFKNINSPEDFK